MTARLYFWQRLTAALMAPLVIIHLAVMVYAINDGLSAGEILGRTRGSIIWGLFYASFVLAAAIHAAIGVRTIIGEWLHISGPPRDWLATGFAALLVVLGLRAVYAVVI